MAFILFFFWLQKAEKILSGFGNPDFFKLKSLEQEIKSNLAPLKEGTQTLKGILGKKAGDLQKIEEALNQTAGSTAGNAEIPE